MTHVVLIGALAAASFGVLDRFPQAPGGAAAAQSTTVEGCLGAGARDGEFALAAGADRYVVIPAAGVQLAAHLNHKVQLTGAVEKGSTGNVLRASAVKMVSTTCDAS
ncbi:MAG: hypothetical protein AB7H93_23125 [Vicinamibacterales bacterium]